MRALIQRVSKASITIDDVMEASINYGLLVFLGVIEDDTVNDIAWLSNKIANLRIFPDENDVMNKSLLDIDGEVIVVSQFTLHASTKKGNRPSYIKAAKPEIAIPIYETFVQELDTLIKTKVQTGKFGANMKVELLNDGPVTISIDTKIKE